MSAAVALHLRSRLFHPVGGVGIGADLPGEVRLVLGELLVHLVAARLGVSAYRHRTIDGGTGFGDGVGGGRGAGGRRADHEQAHDRRGGPPGAPRRACRG